MAALRMRAHTGSSPSLGRKHSPKAKAQKKALNEDHGWDGKEGLLASPRASSAPDGGKHVRPKKLTKRQARRLEQEEARAAAAAAAANQNNSVSSSGSRSRSSKMTKKKMSKKKWRQHRDELQNAGKDFKGPSAPDPDKKIGRSGNIAYGGHGEKWNNTSFSKRLSNNHMLRVKREQAARLRQLERQEAPSSLLSGKAKKQLLKEKRARKREQKRLKAEAEEEEAAAAAELAMQVARLSNLDLADLSEDVSVPVEPTDNL